MNVNSSLEDRRMGDKRLKIRKYYSFVGMLMGVGEMKKHIGLTQALLQSIINVICMHEETFLNLKIKIFSTLK